MFATMNDFYPSKTFKNLVRLFFLAFFSVLALPNYAFQLNCSEVELSDFTTTPATCPGNGTITVPELQSGYFTLKGPGIDGELQQDGNVFESLIAGNFTLSLFCEGHPVEEFIITVANRYSNLDFTIGTQMYCENQGRITVTPSGGFNLGGDGVEYKYAIWPNSVGPVSRPDNEVTYGDVNVFENLSSGTYIIRVKDNCNNFNTKSIQIAPTAGLVNVSLDADWICTDEGLSHVVDINVRELYKEAGYSYWIESLAENGWCPSLQAVDTIVPQSFESGIYTIPPSVDKYRLVTLSPCGEKSFACYSLPNTDTLSIAARTSLFCEDGGETTTRVTYEIKNSQFYELSEDKLPATLVVTGQNGFEQTILFESVDDFTGVISGIPLSAFPLELSYADNCNVTKKIEVELPGSEIIITEQTYNRSCVEQGHVNITLNLAGGIYGLGLPDTEFILLDINDNPVAQGEFLPGENTTNSVLFLNVPAGQTYKMRIDVPSYQGDDDCEAYATQYIYNIEIPASQGFILAGNPTFERNCNDGSHTWKWNLVFNSVGHNVSNGFVIESVDGTFKRTTSSAADVNQIPSGAYNWSVTFKFNGNTCQETISGYLEIPEWESPPTLERSLAVACQDDGGGVQPIGSAMLLISGASPFVVEKKLSTDADFEFVADNVPTGPFYFDNLELGKTYQFRVTDECGKSAVNQVTIKPLTPRVITNTVHPCIGEEYILSGVDFGDPSATYVWYKDGQIVGTDRNLVFDSFTEGDNGTYILKVTLLNGCVNREMSITLDSEQCGQAFSTGSLGDYVWLDLNYDGIQDPDEDPAIGVPVYLEAFVGPTSPTPEQLADPNNWLEVATTNTGVDGKYKFEDLLTGYYRVRFAKIPGYDFTTYQAAGNDPENRNIGNDNNADKDGYSGPVYIDASQGGVMKDNLTVDAGIAPYGSIGDFVWLDENLNGIQDSDEPPFGDVTVNLLRKEGDDWVLVRTTTTESTTGFYLFDRVEPGTYQVEFVLPDGYEFTVPYANGVSNENPSDSDADRSTGRSGEFEIEIAGGGVARYNFTIDAGLIEKGALPVQLSYFNAIETGEGFALLTWGTTEEANSSHFEILQSVDGANWQSIGRVEAHRNSMDIKHYSFTDDRPSSGTNYYRLKMVDLDGTSELTPVRRLHFANVISTLAVYPNPITNRFTFKTSSRDKIQKIELYSPNGQLVLTKNNLITGEYISTEGLSSGTYILKVSMANGAIEYRKVVIVSSK